MPEGSFCWNVAKSWSTEEHLRYQIVAARKERVIKMKEIRGMNKSVMRNNKVIADKIDLRIFKAFLSSY